MQQMQQEQMRQQEQQKNQQLIRDGDVDDGEPAQHSDQEEAQVDRRQF